MSNDYPGSRIPLEENVAKLVSRSQPQVTMPQDDKDRILAALIGHRRSTGAAANVWRKRASWLASTAAAVLLLVFLWSDGMHSGIVWADVVEQLGHVESFTALQRSEFVSPLGTVSVTHSRYLRQDPGMVRLEALYGPGPYPPPDDVVTPDEIGSVIISREWPDGGEVVLLSFRDKTAYVDSYTLENGAREGLEHTRRLDGVEHLWSVLEELTADDTRRIGERQIDGINAVGFEGWTPELCGEDPTCAGGVARVWAAADTAAPLEFEVEVLLEDESIFRQKLYRMKWNVPLSEELFEIPDLSGWEIMESPWRVPNEVDLSTGTLKAEVTLRLGPPGGPTIITEADIESIGHSRTTWENRPAAYTVKLQLTPEGGARLRAFTAASIGRSLVFDLNDGELRFDVKINEVIGQEMRIVGHNEMETFGERYVTSGR